MARVGQPHVGSEACQAGPHLLQTTWASTWLKVTVTLVGCPSTTYTTSGLSNTVGASSRGGPGRRRAQADAGLHPRSLVPSMPLTLPTTARAPFLQMRKQRFREVQQFV